MQIRESNDVVMIDQISIVDRRSNPEISVYRDIDRLFPSRIVRFVQRPSLGDAISLRIRQNEKRIEFRSRTSVGIDEVLSEDHLDREEVLRLLGDEIGVGGVRGDDIGDFVDVEAGVHRVQQPSSRLNVVEFDAALATSRVSAAKGDEGRN